LLAWLHSSDFRMITFWTVLCGGILITLIMTGVFDLTGVSLTTSQVGGPVGIYSKR
jgi:hypothetical protein